MHACGDPTVLSVDEVPPPGPPVGDEITVRVAASSINGTDLGLRRGDVRVATWGRLPFTLGFDLAGEVVHCGPRVSAFRPGDRVAALLGHDGGAQASYAVLRQHRAARVPDRVPLESAAGVVLAGLTALQALHHVGRLGARGRGARVLVVGASGGIGCHAVQLAALAGAHVTAVASGRKLPQVREYGAHELVDRSTCDIARLDGSWDLVLDTPGTAAHAELAGLLAPGGTLVTTRPISRDVWRAAPALLPGRGKRPPSWGAVTTRARPADLAHLLHLLADGRLRSPVDRVLPLERGAEAHAHAETEVVGKVVLSL